MQASLIYLPVCGVEFDSPVLEEEPDGLQAAVLDRHEEWAAPLHRHHIHLLHQDQSMAGHLKALWQRWALALFSRYCTEVKSIIMVGCEY